MFRTLRYEVERYGPYSLAVESSYDHPMLWGSKRTGPDLARIGGKYSDFWHVAHLTNPRDVVPESNMPAYRRSEEHTSELQSLMRIPYAVFCLKKKITHHLTRVTNTDIIRTKKI